MSIYDSYMSAGRSPQPDQHIINHALEGIHPRANRIRCKHSSAFHQPRYHGIQKCRVSMYLFYLTLQSQLLPPFPTLEGKMPLLETFTCLLLPSRFRAADLSRSVFSLRWLL